MDLTFKCKEAQVLADNYKMVSVYIEGADLDDILDNFPLQDIIDCLGEDKILDMIGEGRVKEYFDLTDKE